MLWGDMGMTLAHRVPLSLQWRLQSWVWSIEAIEGTQENQANLGGAQKLGDSAEEPWGRTFLPQEPSAEKEVLFN